MGDSVNIVLEFLKKNRFTKAEASLRDEISSRPDFNGFLQKKYFEEEEDGRVENKSAAMKQRETSQEFIVKEIEFGNGAKSKNVLQKTKGHQVNDGSFADLYPCNLSDTDCHTKPVSNGNAVLTKDFSDLLISEKKRFGKDKWVKNKINSATVLNLMGKQSNSYRGEELSRLPPEVNLEYFHDRDATIMDAREGEPGITIEDEELPGISCIAGASKADKKKTKSKKKNKKKKLKGR